MKKADYNNIPLPQEQLSVHQSVNEVLKDADVKRFVKTYKIDKAVIGDNLSQFLAFQYRIDFCRKCSGLNECRQPVKGKEPFLEYDEGYIVLNTRDCHYQKAFNTKLEQSSRLQFIGSMPNDVNLSNVFVNPKRRIVLTLISEYIKNYPNLQKGMYLYGRYGCGKSYLMMYLAKQLVEQGANVLFVYYPEYVRLVKSSIGQSNDEYNDLIDQLKKAEILILDDLGGETSTPFIRDEVLGPILQDRMLQKRATFVTSNLNEAALFDHLKETTKDSDQVKAQRIIERIKTLMNFTQLDDNNYR